MTKEVKPKAQNQKKITTVYKVVAGGVTIEWTPSFKTAETAYNEAYKTDKQLWLVQPSGSAKLLRKQ